MRRKGNVRLVDIAKASGYTVNTVSRALRDKEDIGKDTKIKIKKLAEKFGYIPNSIATSLRSGFSYTVAIVFDNLINPYYMIMTEKIHRRLNSLGYATMVFAAYNYMFNMESLNPIISRKVDGIITFLEPSLEVVEICKKNKIPIILLGRKNTQLAIDSVTTDDYLGGFKVGELLIKKGVKNVGYIGAPREIECSVRRQSGLKDAFLKHNLPYHEENIRYINSNSIEEEIDVLLANDVDGIFFFNDVLAFEGMKYLQTKNYQIPQKIKIVGYDDITHEFPIPLSLTTVASDKDLIVNTAVDILCKKMQDNEKNNDIQVVDIEVVVRIGNTV